MSVRRLVVVFCFLSSVALPPGHAVAQHRASGHAGNNGFHANSGASRPPSFQRQSSPSNFNFNSAPRGGYNQRQSSSNGNLNYQAQQQARQQAAYAAEQQQAARQQQQARQQAAYAAQQQEAARQQQQEARRQQQAAQQQYGQQQQLAAQRAQQDARRRPAETTGQLSQHKNALDAANEQLNGANRARQEADARARAARARAVLEVTEHGRQGQSAQTGNSHPLAAASEAAQLAHEKALAARARQTQPIAGGQGANPASHETGGSLSPAAQAALERARAARATHTGEAEIRPIGSTGPERTAISASPAAQAALERALAARANQAPNGSGESSHHVPPPTAPQVKQHQQQALTYIAQQKTHVTSRTGFQAAQTAAISKLLPEQQAAVHAKVFHNESLMQAGLRPSTQKTAPGKVELSSLHLLPNSPGFTKLNTGQNNATKTSPTGRQTIILPNGKPFVLNYTPTGHPRVRPPALPVATLGAANAAGQRPVSTKSNSATNALQALAGASGANAAVLTELIVGTIGQAILLAPGLFSGGGLSGPGGGGGGGGFDDGSDDSGGCASAFDSGCVYVPNDDNANGGGDPNGSSGSDAAGDAAASGNGVLLSVNSSDQGGDAAGAGSDGGTSGGAADGLFNQTVDPIGPGGGSPGSNGTSDVSHTVYDAPSTRIDAVPQAGRYLNVINLSAKPANFHVQYHAQDQNGNWAWFPQSPEMGDDAISFDLNAGQAVELWDGEWHVYADKARIWAVSANGQQQWDRYRSNDLLLVSETDDQGQPCYYSPDIQTLSFGLK